MARGLTLLTMRVDGEFRLGVKTQQGILDATKAAAVLDMHAATTVDDLLQNEDGPSLNSLVAAALQSNFAAESVGNDLSARDLQFDRGGQWLVGKTLDRFAQLGPYLVTADQVAPDNLKIECLVNGETRRSSSTDDFIFTPAHIELHFPAHYLASRRHHFHGHS
jgi:hypothetical protein